MVEGLNGIRDPLNQATLKLLNPNTMRIPNITLLELQELTATPWVAAKEISVEDFETLAIFIRFGRIVVTAFTAGVNFRVEASAKSSGNQWNPLTVLTTNIGSSVADEAVSGTCAADQPVILMASTTGFVVGDIVYIDNTTTLNSEWGRIKAVSANVSITLEDNLENAQTGSTVYDQGELYSPILLNVSAYSRIQVFVDGSGAGQNFAVEVKAVGVKSRP